MSGINQLEEPLVMSNNHTLSSTAGLNFLIHHFNSFMELNITFSKYPETI